MRQMPQVSDAELKVMKVLWEKQEAKSSEIIEVLEKETDWKAKTIQTLITRLVTKGIVEADKGEGKAYIYKPIIKEQEYKRVANKNFLQRIYDGSIKKMMVQFLQEENFSKEELEELKAILERKEVK